MFKVEKFSKKSLLEDSLAMVNLSCISIFMRVKKIQENTNTAKNKIAKKILRIIEVVIHPGCTAGAKSQIQHVYKK